MNTAEAVVAAYNAAPEALFVSSLGTATSALRLASKDGPHLYMGGAMGCGLAAALGVAASCPQQDVVAFVGDGDLLMGASSLWSLAGLRPENLLVVLLLDGRYSITGGQPLSSSSSFPPVLAAFSDFHSELASTPDTVASCTTTLPRPGVVVARVQSGPPPGPSPFVDPHRVRMRFAARARGQGSEV